MVPCTHTNTYTEERGRLAYPPEAEARSLVKSSLQDALEGEGDKLEALTRVELALELHPEKGGEAGRS